MSNLGRVCGRVRLAPVSLLPTVNRVCLEELNTHAVGLKMEQAFGVMLWTNLQNTSTFRWVTRVAAEIELTCNEVCRR